MNTLLIVVGLVVVVGVIVLSLKKIKARDALKAIKDEVDNLKK